MESCTWESSAAIIEAALVTVLALTEHGGVDVF